MSTKTTAKTKHAKWREYLQSARDGYSRPVGNNRRVHFDTSDHDRGPISIRLHATDVVTFYPDGTATLAARGWHTVTTAQTIREYSEARLYSERGSWYVRIEPTETDPEPTVRYAIGEPFTATRPAALADHECGRLTSDRWGYARCSTCARHEHAERQWSRYVSAIEEHGSPDAWREAWQESKRAQRADRKAWREWDARNRVGFFDGLRLTPDGYAKRRGLAATLTRQKRAERERQEWLSEQRARARVEQREAAERAKLARAEQDAYREQFRRTLAESGVSAAVAALPADVLDWLADHGRTPNTDGTATLCKVVGPDGFSMHGASYIVGETTTADDYDSTPNCGAGLHFSPTKSMARTYDDRRDALALACDVELSTLVPLGHDKCKSRSCRVRGAWSE